MKFFCDNCNAQYLIADEKVTERGVKVKCKKCAHIIMVKPAEATGAAPSAETPAESNDLVIGTDNAMQAPPDPPTEPKGDSDIAGALDSLFGDNPADPVAEGVMRQGSATTMMSAGSVAGLDGANAASSEPAPKVDDKAWYVAVDDKQIGPLSLPDVEVMWHKGDVTEDNLAWKAGMPDWVPLGDIPDVGHLVRDARQRASDAGKSLGVTIKDADAPRAPAVEWKPAAASALSSLVQEELSAASRPKEDAAKPPSGLPDLGASQYNAQDLFGGQVQGPPPPAGTALGDSTHAPWEAPSPKSHKKSLWVVFGGIGIVVILMGAVMGIMVLRSQKQTAATANGPATTSAMPDTTSRPPTVPVPLPSAPVPSAAPLMTPPAAAVPAPAQDKAAKASDAAASKDDDDDRSDRRRGRRGRGDRGRNRDDNKASEQKAQRSAPAEAAPAAKATLTPDDVRNGVRQNASRVAPCLREARKRNEIGPGAYTFKVDWVIHPDGSVSDAQLKGPENVMGTSLPGCFSSVINTFRFAPSQNTAPVRNFPFGPVTIP